jgi:CheY-like chemotaxis protein
VDSLLASKHLFIVEDNMQNRVVFQMTLLRHGARVEFERLGKDAVKRLRGLPQVDLIILDLMLAQGVSGFDLFDEIRSIPEYAKTPIVAVSAAEPALAVPVALKKGFSGFIAKPIDDELFPQQIASIIAGKQIWHIG